MTEATLAGLLERLDHLERQHRTLKRAASCVALVIAGVLLMGQATPAAPRVIEAEKFVVRDADGQMRVLLTTNADGTALVAVLDRFGRSRAGIGVNPDHSAAVFVQNRSGKPAAAMAVGADEIPAVLLSDKEGKALWKAP